MQPSRQRVLIFFLCSLSDSTCGWLDHWNRLMDGVVWKYKDPPYVILVIYINGIYDPPLSLFLLTAMPPHWICHINISVPFFRFNLVSTHWSTIITHF
jgi:hypothetical protein